MQRKTSQWTPVQLADFCLAPGTKRRPNHQLLLHSSNLVNNSEQWHTACCTELTYLSYIQNATSKAGSNSSPSPGLVPKLRESVSSDCGKVQFKKKRFARCKKLVAVSRWAVRPAAPMICTQRGTIQDCGRMHMLYCARLESGDTTHARTLLLRIECWRALHCTACHHGPKAATSALRERRCIRAAHTMPGCGPTGCPLGPTTGRKLRANTLCC